MNRAELIEIIRMKGVMPEGGREDFETMISQYPWFHSGYALMLASLYQRGDISFDEILNSCSVNIADREVLYYMLNRTSLNSASDELPADQPGQESAIIPGVGSNDKMSGHAVPSSEPEGNSETGLQPGPEQEKPDQEPLVQDDAGTSDDLTASGRSREELLYEIEKRLNEIEEKSRREDLLILGEESATSEGEITDKSHGRHDDQTDTGHPLLPDQDEAAGIELTVESDNESEVSGEVDDHADTGQPFLSDQDEAADIELAVESEEADGEPPLFDSSLLDLDYSPGAYQLPDPDKKKEESGRGEESGVSNQEPGSGDESNYDLINRFLENKPRISPARETDDKPYHDLAENQAEPPDLISETLARIYMSQKYYSKAIHIYEKLCLKYPEKSGYFATQIEKIKELMS